MTRIQTLIAETVSHTEVLQIEVPAGQQNASGNVTVDALAEIAAPAQPIGPTNLAREFDRYTERVLDNAPARSMCG